MKAITGVGRAQQEAAAGTARRNFVRKAIGAALAPLVATTAVAAAAAPAPQSVAPLSASQESSRAKLAFASLWLDEIIECGQRMTPYARQKLLETAREYARAFPNQVVSLAAGAR